MYSVTVNALHRNSARSGKCTTSHCLRSLLLFVVLCTILVVLCFTEVLVDKSTQSVAKEVYINPKYISVNTLIIVPGHGVLKTARGYEWRNNSRWCLESHQLRNDVVLPFCFASHIKRAVEILKTDIVSSVVIFSGGQTCSAAGPRSEALSYYTIAEETGLFGLFETNVDVENILRERLFTEEFAEDSYENLLFSVARFCEITGRFPTSIVVVGWKHKEERFTKYHRKAIRFPRSRFTYVGLDFKDAAPFATSDLPYMMAQPYSDTIALSFVTKDMYLCSAGKQTRRKRNPYSRVAPYTLSCPPLRALLQHCGPHLISSELTPWN
uniref:WGS project CAEQ00000000 data, annotated contig 501 n=1 Tax=Trypanosoma congolense (strain IL3000) TaxID=1068625 RepID=F9WGH2_TRYCI|nr:unnamed protein product [Trypanosoma congolense IL3000]